MNLLENNNENEEELSEAQPLAQDDEANNRESRVYRVAKRIFAFLLENLDWKKILPLVFFVVGVLIQKSSFTEIICQNEIGSWQPVSYFCKGTNWTRSSIPLQSTLEESVRLAEHISNINFSITIELVETRMSLFALKTHVGRSQIESSAKNEMLEKIDQITTDALATKRGAHKMFSKFATVLSGIENYAKSMRRHLKKPSIFDSRWWKSNKMQLDIYYQSLVDELDKLDAKIHIVASDTDKVNQMLENLDGDFNQLNDMVMKTYVDTDRDLRDIDHANAITKFYRSMVGDQDIKRDKHQQNLRTLNATTTIIRETIKQISETLSRLGQFETYVDQTKEAITRMDAAHKDPVNIHYEKLNEIIDELSMYHRNYVKRQKEVNQIE